jgi:MFS transporter, putative metabolite transport protein
MLRLLLFFITALIGATVGAITIGRLADIYGRKLMLVVNLSFFIFVAILCSLSWSVYSLIFFRFLIGVGVGMDYPVCASYLAEVTPKDKSAKYMATAMFFNCLSAPLGVFIALIIFLVFPYDLSWRMMFLSCVIPALISFILRLNLPESFLWKAHKRLADNKSKSATSSNEGILTLFSKKYIRVTLSCCLIWFLMDISYYGIGLFIPNILSAMNIESNATIISNPISLILDTLIISSFTAIGAMVSIFFISKHAMLMQKIGLLIPAVSLLILAVFSHNIYILFMCFALFNFFINFGPGITTYYLPTTVYPTGIRATGHGAASSFGKFGAFIGALTIPILIQFFGMSMTLIILSITLFVGFILTIFIRSK